MAQERCVRKSHSQHRLWLVGEVRSAPIDANGNPVASMHFRLLDGGERVDERKVYSDDKVKEARRESGQRDKRAAITNALNNLDPDDDAHWTRAGYPAIQAIFGLVDFEVSRNEITATAPDFDREHARGLKSS